MDEIFLKNGFSVIRNLISSNESKKLRLEINKVFQLPKNEVSQSQLKSKTYTCPDGVTKFDAFWKIIFNNKLLNAVKNILGDEIRYTQHSDLHINLGAGNYHRDNAYREFNNGPDWNLNEAEYKIVRVAIYLSDYNNSGSSLIVLPGTHKKESRTHAIELKFWRYVRNYLRKKNIASKLPHLFFSNKKVLIKTKPGDCIIFDQRLIHAGGIIKGNNPKYSIFLSYGAPNIHSYNHHNFYRARPTYLKRIPPQLRRKLKEKKLLLK